MLPIPALTNGIASVSFWQQTPTAPAATWARAIVTDLCALACGRTATPRADAAPAMRATFASKASRSSSNDGVATSASESPA